MIKLNLLPQYVLERQRIQYAVITFIVLLGAEIGTISIAYGHLKAQEQWFIEKKPAYDNRLTKIKAEETKATDLAAKAIVYDPYITFFRGGAVKDYNAKMVDAMREAAGKVTGGGAWYDSLEIEKKDVKLTGKINGLMNFVSYYFKLKDVGFNVEPQAEITGGLKQQVALQVTGSITTEIPAAPTPPEKASTWKDFYLPPGATPAAAPADAPGAAPPPAAAPEPAAPAPPPAPKDESPSSLRGRGANIE